LEQRIDLSHVIATSTEQPLRRVRFDHSNGILQSISPLPNTATPQCLTQTHQVLPPFTQQGFGKSVRHRKNI
jgi:hypothetical protein